MCAIVFSACVKPRDFQRREETARERKRVPEVLAAFEVDSYHRAAGYNACSKPERVRQVEH